MTIISLITDFGTQDEYAGLMKAVILGIDPAAVIVDISHSIKGGPLRDLLTAPGALTVWLQPSGG